MQAIFPFNGNDSFQTFYLSSYGATEKPELTFCF
jgi:hypothetical protein